MSEQKKVLEVKNLVVSFRTNEGVVKAVRGVNYELFEGETLAIVGESGSGKSVSSRAIMGILAGNAIIEKGSIIYKGQDLLKLREEEFHRIRGDQIGMIFQDPTSSLNPIMKVGKQIMEGIIINGKRKRNLYEEYFRPQRQEYLNVKYEIDEVKSNYYFRKKRRENLRRYRLEIFQINNNISLTKDEKKVLVNDNINIINELKAAKPILSPSERKAKLNELRSLKVSTKKAYVIAKKAAKQRIKKEFDEHKAKYLLDKKNALDSLNKAINEFKANQNTIKQKLDELLANYNHSIKEVDKKGQRELRSKYLLDRDTIIKESLVDVNLQKNKCKSIKEAYIKLFRVTSKEAYEVALNIMNEVGIPEPEKRINMYPFQFSGGMKQRIVIAIALTAAPEILICDEPTTALDVTIQAQILELIKKIKIERKLSVIFITHNLGVVANMADRVAVMYAGKIVEYGTSNDVFYDPRHPYTWALLSSMPDLNSVDKLLSIPGTPPNMLYPPKGDAFAQRNVHALKIDFEQQPPMFKISDTHYAATWLLDPRAPKVSPPDIVIHRREQMKKHIDTLIKQKKITVKESVTPTPKSDPVPTPKPIEKAINKPIKPIDTDKAVEKTKTSGSDLLNTTNIVMKTVNTYAKQKNDDKKESKK